MGGRRFLLVQDVTAKLLPLRFSFFGGLFCKPKQLRVLQGQHSPYGTGKRKHRSGSGSRASLLTDALLLRWDPLLGLLWVGGFM